MSRAEGQGANITASLSVKGAPPPSAFWTLFWEASRGRSRHDVMPQWTEASWETGAWRLRCLLQGIQTPGWSSGVKGITDVKISWPSNRVLPGDQRVASPALQVALIQSGRSVVWNSIWLINTPQTVASDDKHLLSGIFSLDPRAVGDGEAFLRIHVTHLSPRSLPGPVLQPLRNPKGRQNQLAEKFVTEKPPNGPIAW